MESSDRPRLVLATGRKKKNSIKHAGTIINESSCFGLSQDIRYLVEVKSVMSVVQARGINHKKEQISLQVA